MGKKIAHNNWVVVGFQNIGYPVITFAQVVMSFQTLVLPGSGEMRAHMRSGI